ncbi:MAG: hypothetical protein VX435_11840 [Planctomycetota bacterium]|nr:hypothetical protein [Planctomycetota bacterium]
MKRFFSLHFALCLFLASTHTLACWQLTGGSKGLFSPFPLLNDDHTFNYYYANLTRHFLLKTGTTAGYDPHFMAGYAKSILFPSSSTLPEVILFISAGKYPAQVFKGYVFVAIAILPWLMWISAEYLFRHPKMAVISSNVTACNTVQTRTSTIALSLILFESYFWTDWGVTYAILGMVPFVLSGPLCLLALVLWAGSLHSERTWTRILSTALISFACLVHISSVFVLIPGILVTYGSKPSKTRGDWTFLAATGLMVILVNSFWVIPGFLLLSTLATTATGIGFINPNVLERMIEFFTDQPPVELATVVLAPLGIFLIFRRKAFLFSGISAVIIWSFCWGYLAGWSRHLDFLQPGRYTLYFFIWGSFPASVAFVRIAQRLTGSKQHTAVSRMLIPLLPMIGLILIVPALRPLISIVNGKSPIITELPPVHDQLLRRIRSRIPTGDRIFFEERNRGIEGQILDPFGNLRLSPLLPLFFPGMEVIGGPYLNTHLKNNYTQFGDGTLLGQTTWNREEFVGHVDRYKVRWIVCWSPYVVDFCKNQPDLIKMVSNVPAPFFIGKIETESMKSQPSNDAIQGYAELKTDRGSIIATKLQPESNMVVLPYHFSSFLRTDPTVELKAVHLEPDPMPFIGLLNPPDQVRISIDFF